MRDVQPGDRINITWPGVEGAKRYHVYRSYNAPVFAELTGWARLWARLRRRPLRYVARYETRHELVATTDA